MRNEDQYQADLNINPPAEEATLQEKTEALNNSALMEDDSKRAQTWSDDRSGSWDPPPEVSSPTSKVNLSKC
jgi:hypothetical protein